MPELTVGVPGAEKTGTESVAAKTTPPSSGVTEPAKTTGVDERFAQLTGELGRKDALIEKQRADLRALEEKHKTEDEKRIEQLLEAKYGPRLKREAEQSAYLSSERDALLKQLPEEHRGLVLTGDHVPVEQQITQLRTAINLLTQKGIALPAFSSGPMPATVVKKKYTMAEYNTWANASGDTRKAKFYDDNRDEMQAAVREGRVEGLR